MMKWQLVSWFYNHQYTVNYHICIRFNYCFHAQNRELPQNLLHVIILVPLDSSVCRDKLFRFWRVHLEDLLAVLEADGGSDSEKRCPRGLTWGTTLHAPWLAKQDWPKRLRRWTAGLQMIAAEVETEVVKGGHHDQTTHAAIQKLEVTNKLWYIAMKAGADQGEYPDDFKVGCCWHTVNKYLTKME